MKQTSFAEDSECVVDFNFRVVGEIGVVGHDDAGVGFRTHDGHAVAFGGDEVQIASSGADLFGHGTAQLALGAELLNLGADLFADGLALGESVFADCDGLGTGRFDAVRSCFNIVVANFRLKRESGEGQKMLSAGGEAAESGAGAVGNAVQGYKISLMVFAIQTQRQNC